VSGYASLNNQVYKRVTRGGWQVVVQVYGIVYQQVGADESACNQMKMRVYESV
jgi:hypothetical protein